MKAMVAIMKFDKLHFFVFRILITLVGPFLKLRMGYHCDEIEALDAPSIVIANHNTDLDPVLVSLGFSDHMYFLSSEHALRMGFKSKLLRLLFAPIPINKTRSDAYAIREMLRRLKAGYNVCIFAEGNRSYTGVTGPVAISIAKLVKLSGASLITFRVEGGYFTSPRWSHNMRRGKMKGSVVGRYNASELKSMTNAQIQGLIEQDIYEDAYERQRGNPVRFYGRHLAEHIETALYLCPICKQVGSIRSSENRFFCDCGLSGKYLLTGFLEGKDLPFSTITDWCQWQKSQHQTIIDSAGDGPIFSDGYQKLYVVRSAMEDMLIGEGTMQISHTEFSCAKLTFSLDQINQFAIVGQMTLLFSVKDGTQYEIRSDFPRSAWKYLEIFELLTSKK
jgi:hypothetical protein